MFTHPPSFHRSFHSTTRLTTTPTFSVSNKEQKQILADLNAGSQKFGRKLLSRQPSRRDKSNELITPVTVLPEQQQQQPQPQEERRGRFSTNSNRPKLPKRTSSMRRAYNYFFAGSAPQEPPSPTSPVVTEANVEAVKPSTRDGERDVNVDTPPQTPAQDASVRLVGGNDAEIGMYMSTPVPSPLHNPAFLFCQHLCQQFPKSPLRPPAMTRSTPRSTSSARSSKRPRLS